MLENRHIAAMAPALKHVRVPMSDIDAAKGVAPPRQAKTEQSAKFAAMGAAILEKLCRSRGLRIHRKNTTPYIVDTPNGRVAISVMVSAIIGDPATKHMIVPATSIGTVRGVKHHIVVCAFVSKFERIRSRNGGLDTCLAGWALADELASLSENCRVHSSIRVISVPVSRLRRMDSLQGFICNAENDNEKEVPGLCAEAHRQRGSAGE